MRLVLSCCIDLLRPHPGERGLSSSVIAGAIPGAIYLCFPADSNTDDTSANPVVVEEAMQLSAEVERTPQPGDDSSAAADQIEAAFRERVKYVATMDNAYQGAQRLIETLNKSAQAAGPATKTVL